MPRRAIDREAILGALDAQIMGLLAVKRMVEGLSDEELAEYEPWQESCPDRDDGGAHVVEWFNDGRQGMCRRCGAEFAVEPVGVSDPGGQEPRP